MSKDSGTTPSIPDYSNLAKEQSRLDTRLNRVDQYSPLGNSTWQNNGDAWKVTSSLSPDQQAILDQQENLSKQYGSLAESGLSKVNGLFSRPLDTSGFTPFGVNPGQTGQDAITSRLDPKFAQDENALRTRMANQGLAPGSEAWNNEFRNFNQSKNDAYQQAALQGISIGSQARNQQLQEALALRQQPLNELNALRGGMQLNMPQFQGFSGVQGPNLTGAASNTYNGQMQQYNANTASNNNTMNGLFGLGADAINNWG